MSLPAGTRLGVYEITGLIGAGGMGEVYEARDTRLGRLVALKVLPAEVAGDPERLGRLEREARAAAALNHPNIVTLHGIEESGGTRYLVMELVDGRPLSDLLQPQGLPLGRLLELAIPIAEALSAAHEKGVIHRDLKPGNVMVTDAGRVKVLDFGVARRMAPAFSGSEGAPTETMTEAGGVVGTVPYMAPEQLRGEPVDARADIFSLGAVLYEMASGRRPFQGASAADVASSILHGCPPSIASLRPDLPVRFVRIVEHCLEKDVRRRTQSAADLCRELRAIQERPAAPTATEAGPRAWVRPLAAGVVVLAAVIALFLVPRLTKSGAGRPGPLPVRTLAVLPFENLTHDASQDYFVDGMHEALITDLAKLGTVGVTSRSTVIRYKGQSKPLKEIARELGVDALIEGSVLRDGKRVRITAQLIRGETDEHIWAESYDRDLENVLQLLTDVSRAIASEVRLKVAGGEGPALPPELAPAPRVRPEAWEAYLRGRQLLLGSNTFSAADGWKGLAELQRAVDLDPSFAQGFSGVAGAYARLAFFRQAPLAEVVPKAREAASRALALDDQLGEAHGTLGFIELYFDWSFASARSQLERGVALSPHNFMTRHAWADYLMITGRGEECLDQVRVGLRYEPTSPIAQAVFLFHLSMSHRLDETIEGARRTIATFPGLRAAHGVLADSLWRKGRFDEALTEYKVQFKDDLEVPRLLEAELHRGGPRAAKKAFADRAASRAQAGGGYPLGIAAAYADAGENDLAFSWLEKAFTDRTPQLLHIVAEPDFDGIRKDPRYGNLLRRIGIPMAGGPSG